MRGSIPTAPRVTKTADGRIWFLPIDGVSVVDALRLSRNELPPPVYVERITADHTHVRCGSKACAFHRWCEIWQSTTRH